MTDPSALFSLAMTLPATERVELAQRLIESVDQESPSNEEKPPLAEEINARRERVRSGNYVALEWQDSIRQIRESLASEHDT